MKTFDGKSSLKGTQRSPLPEKRRTKIVRLMAVQFVNELAGRKILFHFFQAFPGPMLHQNPYLSQAPLWKVEPLYSFE